MFSNEDILQLTPKEAKYFLTLDSNRNQYAFSDEFPTENSFYWVYNFLDNSWHKTDVDNLHLDSVEEIRLLEDIAANYRQELDMNEIREDLMGCRDDNCYLRSKHNDHD